jgi:hypothetical protein
MDGRSSCKHVAVDRLVVLFIAIVTTLAVFYIARADKTVKDVEYTSAVVRYE